MLTTKIIGAGAGPSFIERLMPIPALVVPVQPDPIYFPSWYRCWCRCMFEATTGLHERAAVQIPVMVQVD